MLGNLTEKEIEELLVAQVTGRIGCHADGKTYIVPINYLYERNNIFAHSAAGLKIDMMRKNPEVCFQVDEITDLVNWKSAIVWGRYVEIDDFNEKPRIMQKIANHLMPRISQGTAHPSHGITENASDLGSLVDVVVYRIELSDKTGKYEKRD